MQLPLPVGLRPRIALLIVLALLPAFSLVAYRAFAEREKAFAQAEHDTIRLARLAAAKEGALIEAARQLTIAITFSPAVIGHNARDCGVYARTLLAGYPQYTNFGVIGSEGELWCNSTAGGSASNLRDRDYYRDVVRYRQPVLGGYQIGRLSGLPSIVYASPLVAGETLKGVVFASLRASAFGVLGREIDMPPGAVYLIIDHDGKVVSGFPDEPAWQGRSVAQSSLFRAALVQNHGTLRASDVDETARLYGFAWTGKDVRQSVLVAVGVPAAMPTLTANRYLWSSLLTLLLIAGIAMLVAVAVSRAFIIVPVRRLVEATRRIAGGELTYRTGLQRGTEVGELGHAVDEMAAALERQQDALRDREARFRGLTELSSDWYWEQDSELCFNFLSRETPAARLHSRLRDVEGIDLQSADFDALEHRCAAHESFRDFIYRVIDSRGSEHWIALSGEPIFDWAGQLRGYRGVGREVTNQKRSQLDLEEGKRFLDAVIRAIPAPVVVKDERHRYVAANAAFEEFYGIQDIKGKTDFDFFAAEDAAFFQRTDMEALELAKLIEYERAYTLNGVKRTVRVRKSQLLGPGTSRFVVVLLNDITERRAFEEALQRSEERFRKLIELSADWYWEQDEQLRFVEISVEAADKSGVPGHSSVGFTRWDHPGVDLDSADWVAHQAACRAHQPFRDFEYRRTGIDGITRWLAVSGEPVFAADGRFRGYRGVGRDITASKLAQQEVIRHKDLYAALSQTNRAIVHIREPEALFKEICRVAVDYGHFCLVWIGMLDESGWVRVGALAGPSSAGYPQIRVSIDPDVPEGRGFSAAALREGRHYIVNDYFAHPRIGPWAEAARAANVKSMGTFPLKRDGRVVGLLNLHGTEVGFFTDQLVDLLSEMAENISFALTNMQRESERGAAQLALIESEQRFRQLASNIPEVFWVVEPRENRTTYVSPAYEKVWGRDAQRVMEDPGAWLEAVHPDDRGRMEDKWRAAHAGFDEQYRIIRPDGSVRWIQDRAFPLLAEDGGLILVTGIAEDITERKAAEERLRYLAHYDTLTGLPNRPQFYDRLRQALLECHQSKRSGAVVFIDLDKFKVVNDTLGHAAGDDVMRQAAQRLQRCLRPQDTVSRMGGDEFALILTDRAPDEPVSSLMAGIMQTWELPFEIDGREWFVTASAGITTFPAQGNNAETLLKNADTAMYRAKELGRNRYQAYRAEMNVRSSERTSLEGRLRRALERKEFVLHFQPKVGFATEGIIGVEALLRWQHPELGLLPPQRFLPILEDTGLIVPVGEWVLESAAAQLRQWDARGLPNIDLAVNLSWRQLQQKGLQETIGRILQASGLETRRLELELTESALMRDAAQTQRLLNDVTDMGVRLTVDGLGTGYSSLSELRRLPLEALKVDRSFVKDLGSLDDSAVIVKAAVALAHELKLKAIAVGVETAAQQSLLQSIGCDQYQGYYFSRAVPAEEIVRLLQRAKFRVSA